MSINTIIICGLLLTFNLQTTVSVDTVSTACDHTTPCALRGGSALPRCPDLRSNDGLLDVALTVEIGHFQFEWLDLTRRSYNGTKCPPTMWIKPGDTLNVTLVNELKSGNHTPEGNPAVNITNLHAHGLHMSPLEPQDNVFIEVQPGESYQYSYKILDYHSPGTNWYHPHHHLSTTVQTVGGMAGMLIIEDDPEAMPSELRAVSCPENCQHDIPLIVSPMLSMPAYMYYQTTFGDSLRLPNELETWLRDNLNDFAVNGEFMPVITLEMNQLTRFRILNVGQLAPLELYIVDDDGNVAPCDFREIARDGVYFDEPRIPRFGQSILHPANRLDWLIKCTQLGSFKLYSHAQSQHTKSFGGGSRKSSVIATIHVTERVDDNTTSLGFPTTLSARPQEYLADLRDATPDQYITVEIGGNNELNRDVWKGPDNYRFKVEVDSVVEIQMISADYSFAHPIHFHINHVQVIGLQPYTGPVAHYQFANPTWEFRERDGDVCYYQHPKYVEGAVLKQFNISDSDTTKHLGHYDRWVNSTNDSLAYDLAGQWIDTVFVPALSNMTYRMKTDKFTGPLLIHCHIPADSDLGMMMVIEVVEKGANLNDANILAGGAAPGSCRKCDWNRFMETPKECSAGVATTFRKSILLVTAVLAVVMPVAL